MRNLATVGGNLCNAAPSADMAPALLVLDATVKIAGPSGNRDMPLEEFFMGPGKVNLARGEMADRDPHPIPSSSYRTGLSETQRQAGHGYRDRGSGCGSLV